MKEAEFKAWLEASGLSENSIGTRMSMLRRIERVLAELGLPYADLDAAFDADELVSTRAAVLALKEDFQQGGQKYRVLLPESENPAKRLANFPYWLDNYRDFRHGKSGEGGSIAEQIRQHALTNYIEPARERGEVSVSIRSRAIHDELDLENAFPSVCQALSGRKFRDLAKVGAPSQEGPDNSSTTVFTYTLISDFSVSSVEAELTRRFGPPLKQVQYISAWQLADGRQIALERERPPAQLWVEADAAQPPAEFQPESYTPTQGRHSGLPPRLNHKPSAAAVPRTVAMVRVGSMAQLAQLLDWYQSQQAKLNRDALEVCRKRFLARYRDFLPRGFGAGAGSYYDEERAGKDGMIRQVQGIVQSAADLDEAKLGQNLLDFLLSGKGEASWLFNWRAGQKINAVRAKHPSVLEMAAGRLARAEDISSSVAAFVEATWGVLSEGQTSRPYSESRLVPSMLAALIRPESAYGINTGPFKQLARDVIGDQVFGENPMSRLEYERALGLAQSIRTIMAEEWGWSPRDLWDVQSFVWAVGRSDDPSQPDDMEETGVMLPHVPATNLILYGPPGTGKTYQTAYEAVRLCDGEAPEDRATLMTRYRELVAAGQIAFTTFHQSYAYEDFVEGLRPVTSLEEEGEGSVAGFSLQPKAGVFREIATLAEAARKRGGSEEQFDVTGRRIFKMSLGRAGSEDHIFDAAVAGGYVATGWGGGIDWSDRRYDGKDGYEAIHERWNQDHPGTHGHDGNISQLWCLRSQMAQGDIVVVSEGNSYFRAIAEITGPYRFVPNQEQGYSHQRPVRWLATFDEPLPVDTIYAKPFTQRACYKLREQFLKKEALARLISPGKGQSNARPDQFVLVIDEINRANISKVFGELITLLEPGKRLGAEDALTVTLPYSRIPFGVPENLHIVGTMNTADRSIALLDTALRRRFDFRECMPEPELLEEATEATGINLVKMLTTINQRIEYLFDREHQIGHAYLIGCRTRDDVDAAMRHRIIPLLTEYFYDDWSKVAVVLGDAGGAGLFLERALLPVPPGLADAGDGEPRYRWSVRPTFEGSCYDQFA